MRYKVNFIDEKIDVYSLGNIFYKLIANEVRFIIHYPNVVVFNSYTVNYANLSITLHSILLSSNVKKRKYHGISNKISKQLILEGDIPNVEIKDEIDEILYYAMKMCLQVRPNERASAKEVHGYLSNELERFKSHS